MSLATPITQTQYQDLYNKLQLLGVENERLNQVLREVNIENSQLRGHLEKAAGIGYPDRVLQLSHQIRKLAGDLAEKNLEIEDLKTIALQSKETSRQGALQSDLEAAKKEIERLHALIKEKSDECETLKKHASSQQQQLPKNEDKERIKLLLSEVERLSIALNEANNQNEALRKMQKDMPDGRSEDGHRNEKLNGEASSRKGKPRPETIQKLNDLTNQCEKLTKTLVERNNENLDLQRYVEELKSAFVVLAQENEGLKNNINQIQSVAEKVNLLEDKCHALIQENENLNELLKQQGKPHGNSKMAGDSHALAQLKKENEALKQSLAEADREVNRLKSMTADKNGKTGRPGSEADNKQADSKKAVNDKGSLSSRENGNAQAEIDSLNQKLKEKAQENEVLKNKIAETRNVVSRIEDIQNKSLELANENDRLNKVIETLQKENEGLNKIAEQIPKLAEETQKLQKLLQEADQENQNLKQLVIKTHSSASHVPELENKLGVLATELERVNENLINTEKENTDLKAQLKHLSNLSKSTTDLGENFGKLDQENKDLKGQVRQLTDENVSLKDTLSHWEKELREALDVKGKVHSMMRENEEIHQQLALKNAEVEKLQRELEQAKRGKPQTGLREEASSPNEATRANLEELKGTIKLLESEIDRLNGLMRKKAKESGLREKSSGFDDSPMDAEGQSAEVQKLASLLQEKDSELAALKKNQAEFERLIPKITELEAMNKKLTDDNHYLFSELKNFQTQLESKDLQITKQQEFHQKEIEELAKEANARFTNDLKMIDREFQVLKEYNQQLEARIPTLVRDNEALSAALNQKTEEVKELRAQVQTMTQNNLKYQNTVSGNAKMIEDEMNNLRQRAIDSEEKLQKLNAEIERLTDVLQGKTKEVEEWRKKFQTLEVTRAQEIEDLRVQFETYKKSNLQDVNDYQIRFAAERTSYETQLTQLQQTITAKEEEINELKANLNLLVQEKKDLQSRVDELNRHVAVGGENPLVAENAELKAQLELFKSNNFDIKQIAIRYGAERAIDQSQIKQLKQMNNNYREELEKVYELINERKVAYEHLMKEHENLKKELMKQSQVRSSQGEDPLRSEKHRIETLQKQIEELTSANQDYQRQAEKNNQELLQKSKELTVKISEVDALKAKYDEALANYQNLNSQLFQKLSNAKQ